MDKEDARKQSLLELHTRRKQVVRLHRKGMGVMQIVEMSGLSWPAVRAVLTLFEQGGWPALKPRARGKAAGNGRVMTPEQEQAIRSIIGDERPEQMRLDFALWNRGAVAMPIEREYDLKLTIRAVGNYLERWGMTPQKPIKRAYEQKPEALRAWLDEQYPAIEARAKDRRIEVFYLPSYSPQLNPDERLNADLKYALGSSVAMRNISALWHATVEYMTMLEQSPERVMSYFQDPRVRYAA